MAYTKYSLTPANNNAAPPDGAPEGMLPSAVNDTMRDMMAQIRDVGDGIRGGTYTMTAPVITGGSVTGSTINNSAIGGTTAAAGAFTTLGATGVATFSAGTVSAPAITTTGDTNTGIFFPAADTIAFTEGGVESMRIDSSGNLGIGVTSPASPLDIKVNSGSSGIILRGRAADDISTIYFANSLNSYTYAQIQSTSTAFNIGAVNNNITFSNGAGAGTERMRIDSTGNVGIGTSSPGVLFDVGGAIRSIVSGGVPQIYFNDGTSQVNINGDGGAFKFVQSSIETMRIDSSGNLLVGTTTAQSSAANRGNITIGGSGGAILNLASTSTRLGYLFHDGANVTLSNDTNGYLALQTNNAERMRIDSSGNLLIGTTSQVGFGKFCVLADSSAVNQVALQDSGTTYATNIGYINFTNSTGGQAGFIAHTTATTVAYLTTSDARLKENIVDAPSALSAIKNVKVRSYNWKEGKEKVTYGFVAQELYTEIPEVVGKGDDKAILENSGDVWQLEYGRLTPILFKAIQEQQAMIETLTTRLNALEGK